MVGIAGACWGILGISFILISAIYRLGQIAFDSFQYEFSWYHWVFLVIWFIFMLISEGYRGFQKKFSPRVVARAKYLIKHPSLINSLLAPFFCMAFFHAPRKRMITSYCLTVGMVILVIIVRQIEQPWRGIVDVGVVGGLLWGLISIFIFMGSAMFTNNFHHDPEVPKASS